MVRRCRPALVLFAALPLCLPVPAASAAGAPCPFTDIDVAAHGLQPFRDPPVVRGSGTGLSTVLEVRLTDPARQTLGGCGVELRTYNGELVGPTLRVRPGQTLNIKLRNRLPAESPQQIADQVRQQADQAFLGVAPHSYNTTNLHTHGLHVSPQGNSDNVLLAIAPQTEFDYEIKVPADHPPGTFWYHPHAHGSTAIQVGSGMAGALIIDDDPARLPPALREATAREKVFVLQTILYDAQGRADDIAAFFPDSKATAVLCQQGKSGCTWANSKRRVTINGQIVPVIRLRPGEVQRWRFIDSSFRESFQLQLEGHALHEIALDGLYTGRVDSWSATQSIDLQAGYRSDVLVKASARPGRYRLLDAGSPPGSALRGSGEPQNVLAEVVVDGDPLDMALPASAEMAALAAFPGVDLRNSADGVQTAVFKIGSAFDPKDPRNSFQVNYRSFDPHHVRKLRLGATEMWSLSTVGDPPGVPNCGSDTSCGGIPPLPHIFHIHVNPFQVQRQDPQGRSQLVWKDTQFVGPGQTVNIWTRYLDYIGSFVMHCHILDHEDLGMMEVVEVVSGDALATGHGKH